MIELDDDVVDSERGEGAEQVLDRLDRHGLARQPGLILDAAQMRDRGGDFKPTEVRSLEADAVISGSRLQRQRHFVAGMKPDASARHGSAKGSLRAHDLSSRGNRVLLSKGPATIRCWP